MFNFFFLSHSPCACNRLPGVGKGGKVLVRIPHGLKYPPVQYCYNCQAPLLPPLPTLAPFLCQAPRAELMTVAWDLRKRFCNSIFLLALVKDW